MKVFRLLTAALKKKTGIDFQFVGTNESDTFRIIPKFIFETKQKAESGDAQAMFEYSECLQKYHSLREAHEWHTKAAKTGNLRAMAEEGNFILYGWGCEQNFQKARECYKKAFRWKYRKIINQLSNKDFHLETDGRTVLEKIREFYK